MLESLFGNKKQEEVVVVKPALDELLAGLEKEDINNSSARLTLWHTRSEKEGWNFNDANIIRLHVQSFIAAYNNSILCAEYGYFLLVRDIDYINSTVTFIFKNRGDVRVHTFHPFDFERVIRGCNEVLGVNVERSNYLLNTSKENVEDSAETVEENSTVEKKDS